MLDYIEGAEVVSLVENLLEDQEEKFRLYALRTLGRLNARSSASSVEGRLEDSSSEVRRQAVETLAALQSKESTARLTALSEDPVPAVRIAVARAVHKLDPDERLFADLARKYETLERGLSEWIRKNFPAKNTVSRSGHLQFSWTELKEIRTLVRSGDGWEAEIETVRYIETEFNARQGPYKIPERTQLWLDLEGNIHRSKPRDIPRSAPPR